MADWKAFNAWEEADRRRVLPHLTPEESIRQYFELWEFAQQLAKMGPNYDYLVNMETSPHLRDLIEFKKTIAKVSGNVE
jgi:hypothetical protein